MVTITRSTDIAKSSVCVPAIRYRLSEWIHTGLWPWPYQYWGAPLLLILMTYTDAWSWLLLLMPWPILPGWPKSSWCQRIVCLPRQGLGALRWVAGPAGHNYWSLRMRDTQSVRACGRRPSGQQMTAAAKTRSADHNSRHLMGTMAGKAS